MGSIRTYQGATAFITGGASGIGRAIGEELARRGAEVVLTDVQVPLVDEAAEAIERSGGKATAARLDVRDADAVDAAIVETMRRTGRLDYVFANAGTGVFGEAHLVERRDWDLVGRVNYDGVVNVVEAAWPRLVEQGFGHFVGTGSVAGLITSPFLTSYTATKHAVVGLCKALRIEGERFGVRASALCPGPIHTPILTCGAHGRTVYEVTNDRIMDWWKRIGVMELEPFAKQACDAFAKNEGVIVLPKKFRAIVALLRSSPWLEEKITRAMHAKTLRDFPEFARFNERSPSADRSARDRASLS
jgi:NAD(P)-dependent dehydrogenase (short-subunit alcohol dehydrogenase family)